MALFRDIKLNTGTVNDRFGAVGTVSGATFSQKSKGQALEVRNAVHVTYNQPLLPTGAFTVVAWVQVPLTINRINIISNLTFDNAISPRVAAGNFATLYLAPNNNRLWNTPAPDGGMHCYIYTVPGSAQTDINNSKLFIDNVEATVVSTDVGAVQSSRSIYTSIGGGNNNFNSGHLSRVKVYDHVLSNQEINAEYEEFLNAQPINKAKRGFTMPNKPTDLSPLLGSGAGQGLVGAWNMVKTGNLLVDVSGGGRNATVASGIVSTPEGIQNNTTLTTTPLTSTIPAFGTGDYSVSFRCIPYVGVTSGDLGVIGSASGGITIYARGSNGSFAFGKVGVNDLNLGSINTFRDRVEVTCTVVRTGTVIQSYINGVLNFTGTDSNDYTSGVSQILSRGTTSTPFYGVFKDLRIHNRALSVTEIIQYHNSFVQPTVIDDLSDAGADTITKSVAPMREWERLTGTWKIDENVISNSPIYTSNFSAGVDSWVAVLGGSVTAPVTIGGLSNVLEYTISGGSNFHVAQRTVSTVLGGRYTVTGKIYFPSSGNTNGFQIASTDGVTVYGTFTPVTQDTWYDFTLTYTARGSTPNSFRIIPLVNGSTPFSNDGQKYYIRDINIIQVPQLETMVNGTKYLECMSNGMIAIPCNTAYGSWEWDWYIGSTGNTRLYQFAVNSNKIGYAIIITSATALGIFDTASGTLNSSANSYITANTWYRLRLTRSASGVFTTLIKGGAFTPTAGQNGWTLVSVTGGSGTNPLTSTTYSTSQYFIVDIKVSDRFANLVVNNGIKQ
jgi:hypothetical protein